MYQVNSMFAQLREAWKNRSAYLWLLPSAALIFLVIIYPIFELFVTAFSKVSLSGLRKGFYGLGNFELLIREGPFKQVMLNTFVWTVAVVGVTVVLSIVAALLLNQNFPGRKWVRGFVIIPWAASLEITSLIWRWIFDFNYGALNNILVRTGLLDSPVY